MYHSHNRIHPPLIHIAISCGIDMFRSISKIPIKGLLIKYIHGFMEALIMIEKMLEPYEVHGQKWWKVFVNIN